jgi:hypothetical protein
LSDKNNDHGYWWYEDGKKEGLSYRSDALVEWYNTFVFRDDKARVLESGCHYEESDYPVLYF